VAVTTGQEIAGLAGGFTVVGTPRILSANPNTGEQGKTLSTTITGQFTHFVNGTTQANLGAGISVGGAAEGTLGPVTVTSATTATAQLVINASAVQGLRDVSVRTGAETAILANGFGVLNRSRRECKAP
jgi:hypothetical protein